MKKEIQTPMSLMGEGLLVPKGRLLVYGSPESYKTFWTQHLLFCLATGKPFFGLQVEQSVPTLYVQLEVVERQFQERSRRLVRAHPSIAAFDNVFYVLDEEFVLDSKQKAEELIEAVEAVGAGAVVLDPLNMVMAGDENDGRAVKLVRDLLEKVRLRTGALVGVVHHANKGLWHEGELVYRPGVDISGRKELWAWPDTVVRLRTVRGQMDRVEVLWEKARHREKPPGKWLKFNKETLVLEEAENDPARMVLEMLGSGPVAIGEIDGALVERCGFRGNRCLEFRKELVQRGWVEEKRDPENSRRKLLVLKGGRDAHARV